MFKDKILRMFRNYVLSPNIRYITLPGLANFVTTTAGAADVMGAYAEIDDGTGTAVTGGYDGAGWIAGLFAGNFSQATEYYDIAIALGAAAAEVNQCIFTAWTQTTVVADGFAIFWLPRPIYIGAAPVRIACQCAEGTGAGTVDLKVVIAQGL